MHNNPKISMIAAVAKNLAIGKDNKLLWNLPEDLKHFKKITEGHPVLMGQKTFESLGRPLSNRVNIIITLNPDYKAEGCVITHSLDEALDAAKQTGSDEVFVIGGGSIYKQFLPKADKLYITLVEKEYEADTFFPDYSEFKKITFSQPGQSGDLKYTFLELER